MKYKKNNEKDEWKIGKIKRKIKEKLKHLPIEKRKRKMVNIILKKNKTTKKTNKRNKRNLR
jgi:hypothetical protein